MTTHTVKTSPQTLDQEIKKQGNLDKIPFSLSIQAFVDELHFAPLLKFDAKAGVARYWLVDKISLINIMAIGPSRV